MRQFQDDLLRVNAARLRALGVIVPGATSATVSFGEGDAALKREIKVWHRAWSCGRGLSLFLCPRCGGKAQILRLFDGRRSVASVSSAPACSFGSPMGRGRSGRRLGRGGLRGSRRSSTAVRFAFTLVAGGGSSGAGPWS